MRARKQMVDRIGVVKLKPGDVVVYSHNGPMLSAEHVERIVERLKDVVVKGVKVIVLDNASLSIIRHKPK